jgi:hypothetical protein
MSDRVGHLSVLPVGNGQPYGMSAAPHTLDLVDSEVRRIVEECYGEACRMLEDNRHRLDALAVALVEHETLEEADAYRIAGVPSLSDRSSAEGVVGGSGPPWCHAQGFPSYPTPRRAIRPSPKERNRAR